MVILYQHGPASSFEFTNFVDFSEFSDLQKSHWNILIVTDFIVQMLKSQCTNITDHL